MNDIYVSAACAVFGAGVSFIGLIRYFKKDTQSETEFKTRLETKIDYMNFNISDIKSDVKAQSNKLNDLDVRVAKVEESSKSAHKRIDEVEDRIKE